MDRNMQEPIKVLPFDKTKAFVVNKFSSAGSADGIEMDVLKVSLLDPVSFTPSNNISAPKKSIFFSCLEHVSKFQ